VVTRDRLVVQLGLIPTLNYYWAKTIQDKQPGISVLEHLLNVGYVAQSIANSAPELLKEFQIEARTIAALAALHDLGKISPGFQCKCDEWLKEKNLLDLAARWNWKVTMESDHGKVSHAALQTYFQENGVDETTAAYLSAVLGGHHGRLNPPDERGFRPQKAITESHSGIDWDLERKRVANSVVSEFGVTLTGLRVDDSSPTLWWVGGLTSVADWIGSDETYFPPEGGMSAQKARENAKKCLDEIGFRRPRIREGLSFHDLFHDASKPNDQFIPNSVQSVALKRIRDRGVYVIEAPMGMGKTEAALGAAYQLLVSRKASGIYFALPTQATSNRMHLRMAEFVRRIASDTVETKVIHGNTWLNDEKTALSPARTISGNEEGAEVARDWYSSAKKALLAPFGVGTVDQALLGVVAAKHFFVRHFALAGKVVILDEIHSYDLYTGTLIDRLIETLEKLGCTVIVLSATLSQARRSAIVPPSKSLRRAPAKEPYPLITGRQNGEVLKPVPISPPKPRTIAVAFKSDSDALSIAVKAAKKGACVGWVCDTVESAQQTYLQLIKEHDSSLLIGLLHSRFPFWRREQLEDEWMNRLGKKSSTRCGSILVSTQVVEQSVDLDFDLLITELAPTDMLLQRMGRLWRHDRGKRPVPKPQLFIAKEQKTLQELRKAKKEEIKKAFGDKALVYEPYVLLRSMEVWRKLKNLRIPTDVRKLIERTYQERKKEPKEWQQLMEKAVGDKLAYRQKALMSGNLWNPALPDEEGAQTRVNEIPTLSLFLCRSLAQESAEFVDGRSCSLQGEKFQLHTAQAFHRNLVKIPQYHFGKDELESHPVVGRYVRGMYAIGRVGNDGKILVKGIKSGTSLRWDMDLGLVIEKGKT
jgi:CRISPR-associated endonuclease/helicase Cas3